MLYDATFPTRHVRFHCVVDAEPGALPRLLVPFARRDLTPDEVVAERRGDSLQVTLGMAAMPSEMAHLVAGNLRQVVGVTQLVVEYDSTASAGRLAA